MVNITLQDSTKNRDYPCVQQKFQLHEFPDFWLVDGRFLYFDKIL